MATTRVALCRAVRSSRLSSITRISTHRQSWKQATANSSSFTHYRWLSSSTTTSGKSSTSTPEAILDECASLYDSLTVLNDKLGGMAIPPSSDRATSMPFCLLVGNHSSGKSSFINYVLQRDIQRAGVAPTDDSFTVISPGTKDSDADGPTLVGDPDLGFASLRQFGPTLIHHTQLKYRTSRLNFMLVSFSLPFFLSLVELPVIRLNSAQYLRCCCRWTLPV